MQTYYAARAPEYDSIYLKPERQADLRAIEQWLLPIFSEATVLEVACGTGYWTQFIAQTASHVSAIDAASETIDIARGRVPASVVEFLIGDAYALPACTRKYDAAFAGFWFSHVPMKRRREFLLGLNTVLKPGAKVVLLDNRYVEGSSSPVVEQDANGDTYQVRKLSDGTMYRVLKNFPSEAELRTVITGLGDQAAFTAWEYYWAFEYVAVKP
jgi:demethylmenaquinone methyltransferase/2-methoxy-6-polyprenyl-1,4-benzoquinol methylase